MAATGLQETPDQVTGLAADQDVLPGGLHPVLPSGIFMQCKAKAQRLIMAKPDTKPKQVIFEGEEAGAGFASPLMDFIASAFLLLIAGAFMVGSLALPVPGSLATAPGLLPFLTAASLGLMALALAWTAWQRWRASRLLATRVTPFDWDLPTELRTLALALCVLIYISALQILTFRTDFALAGFPFVLSAFEPVTIVVLVAIMSLFWRGPLWISLTVSIAWTVFLSLVFRNMFHVPLPGS